MIDLTKELHDVVSSEFKQEIENIFKKENITSNAQVILSLCKIITNKINIIEHEQYMPWLNGKGKVYRRENNISQELEKELMVYGTQLIYLLRTFIHNETITFHMSSRSKNGSYSASALVPQSEILKSLSAVSSKSIGVTTEVQKGLINKYKFNTAFQIKRKNLWQQVEYLATPWIDTKTSKAIEIKKKKDGSPHLAYQSLKKDIMVYIAYHGNGENNYTKYYDMTESGTKDSLMVFNNGWLWEWYNKILQGFSEEDYLNANMSIENGSLRPIMLGADYTPGTKEGDFQDMYGRQIQSKYANSKIISFNNIRHVIYDLERALIQYINEEKDAPNNLLNILQEHFFPETVNNGNAYINEVSQNLLKNLQKNSFSKSF